ncbi:MAG: hypothetical protein OIF32_12510 [Campylobacterales bacterium]|nr:hypothetical protein [Campylobacterales bacterium]
MTFLLFFQERKSEIKEEMAIQIETSLEEKKDKKIEENRNLFAEKPKKNLLKKTETKNSLEKRILLLEQNIEDYTINIFSFLEVPLNKKFLHTGRIKDGSKEIYFPLILSYFNEDAYNLKIEIFHKNKKYFGKGFPLAFMEEDKKYLIEFFISGDEVVISLYEEKIRDDNITTTKPLLEVPIQPSIKKMENDTQGLLKLKN